MALVFWCENMREQVFLNIVCNMGFKKKTYGLNFLVVP